MILTCLHFPPPISTHKGYLTRHHLIKASLLFLWSRYPIEEQFRHQFPDVSFDAHNTAQLLGLFQGLRDRFYQRREWFVRKTVPPASVHIDERRWIVEQVSIEQENVHDLHSVCLN